MKYILILALTIACTSKEKKSEPLPHTGEYAEQADVKPASPYTVKPCYCMKIFKPVCAGGVNYGNSCEAECNGHKTWTEGNCAAPKKK